MGPAASYSRLGAGAFGSHRVSIELVQGSGLAGLFGASGCRLLFFTVRVQRMCALAFGGEIDGWHGPVSHTLPVACGAKWTDSAH